MRDDHGGVNPWTIGLDEDGPHFVVAGTTGSGKSAFLETLVQALCWQLSPRDLHVALLDFKGGAGLASSANLPHVVGMVTDLDVGQAKRALAALAAAVVERKAALAQAGMTSFAQWEASGGAPARLLVVVDEFQEVTSSLRDFVPDLTRIAAQGRSLGMHVVLATQRPTGAITPDIRANTATTISFRTASEAESRDVVGTAEAAQISASTPGRGVVCRGHERLSVHAAMALAEPSPRVALVGVEAAERSLTLADAIVQRWSGEDTASPLWHPPLPELVTLAGLPTPGVLPAGHVALGIADDPQRRERAPWSWDATAGPLVMVAGTPQARTELAAGAAASADASGLTPIWLPVDPRLATRTLWLARHRSDVMVVCDDLAATVARLGDVDRAAGVDLLTERASSGLPLAVTVAPGQHHRLVSHASARVIATGLSDQDDALWSVPRHLQGLEHAPHRARVWSAHGWLEATIVSADSRGGSALVAGLALPDRHLAPGAIGVLGDDARPLPHPQGDVCVVGAPGAYRDAVVTALENPKARVSVADNTLILPPGTRDGIIVVLDPTSRHCDELCRASGVGLVDAIPDRGSVLWVEAGRGSAARLSIPFAAGVGAESVAVRAE